jgi:PAS domain S-box-containing protein
MTPTPPPEDDSEHRIERRLAALVEATSDAIIVIDHAQKITLINRAGEAMFGYPRAALLGESIDKLIPLRFHHAHHEHVERFGHTGTTQRRMGGDSNLVGLRRSGEEFPIDASISHLTEDGRPLYTVILRDITFRKRAEDAERRSDRRLAAVVDTTTDAIIIIDHQHNITLANQAVEKMFGHARESLMGKGIDLLLPQRFRQAHRSHIKHFGRTGTSVRRMGGEANVMGLRANGEEFSIDASISHLMEDGKQLYTVILRDITARRQAQLELEISRKSLRELYDGLQTIREEERKRIARELHDDLGQGLAALRIDLTLLRAELPRDDTGLAERAASIDDALLNTIKSVRRISSDLRPRPLDDLGLVAAVQMLAEEVSQRHRIAISVDAPLGELSLPDEIASPLFRMVQEALTNVVKHAEASSVAITFSQAAGELTLSIDDDGKGINPTASSKSDSFGLIGMRERLRAMGGRMEIVSTAAKGTRIAFWVPFRGGLPSTTYS